MLPSTAFDRGVPTLHTDASGTAPPDAFGPFRVLHQIGVGVLGPVFRAYQPDPGRLVAVKQFRLDLPPENAHRFVAALDRLIAADLTHLGIAAPLAAGLTDASPFLALDFVAAESFDVVVREVGPSPVTEALRLATQLGGALDFAAAVGVFHGALHPRDVLVSADDTRVTGLGIVQALEGIGVAPPVRRPYTAPERVAGSAWDTRADLFSLAALVFEMLFGRRIAGTGSEAVEAMPEIEGADIDRLRALFARALAENPADRFDTGLGFSDALHDALSHTARPTRTARVRRRRDADASAQRPSRGQVARLSLPLDTPPDLPLRHAAGEIGGMVPEVESFTGQPYQPTSEPVPSDAVLGAAVGTLDDAAPVEDDVTLHAVGGLPLFESGEVAERGPAPAAPPTIYGGSSSSAPHDQSRSSIWPITLALVVGLLVGFAFGYGTGTRDRTTVASGSAETAQLTTAPGQPAAVPAPPSTSAPAPGGVASLPSRVSPGLAGATPPNARAQASESVAPRPRVPAPAAPARSAPENGRLLVRSTPAGARVLVNGRDAGITPLTVTNLPPGLYVVGIARQGYVGAERRVRINAAQPAQPVEVELVATRDVRSVAPQPAVQERTGGSLMVDSRPAGARVFVDGKLVGTTPFLLDAVNAGDHAVRIELDGFTPWTTTSRVTGGERTRISGSLERR